MYGYIYITIDHLENKVYVGQHKSNNAMYMGSGKIIRNIIKKRKHLLEKRILGYCESKEELDLAEQECIKFYNAQNPIYGYNIANGGNTSIMGLKHSLEAKKKIASASRNRIWKTESREKLQKANLGSNNPMFGKEVSEETRLKLSIACSGNPHSHTEEAKTKISKSHIGLHHSNEAKKKISIATAGKNNPMHGKSLYDVWLSKFGKETADQKYQQWKYKLSNKGKMVATPDV